MRRRYREKSYKCGEFLEVDIYPTFEVTPRRRKARYKATTAMQERLNQKNAERELIRILNTNFSEGDLSVTLTYRDDVLPECEEAAMRDVKNFLRRVKRVRAKRGLSEMRYVIIPGDGRYHFHVAMSGGLSDLELARIWGLGRVNTISFQLDEHGLEGHACYVARQYIEDQYGGADLLSALTVDEETGEVVDKKRKKGQRRYICSKNIERPTVERRDGRISARRVEELATYDNGAAAVFEKLYPGYTFAGCIPYYNDENGGYYLQIKMYKKDAAFMKRRRGRGGAGNGQNTNF